MEIKTAPYKIITGSFYSRDGKTFSNNSKTFVGEATGVNPFVPLGNNFVANGVAHGPPAH
jgi:hypothetical protein